MSAHDLPRFVAASEAFSWPGAGCSVSYNIWPKLPVGRALRAELSVTAAMQSSTAINAAKLERVIIVGTAISPSDKPTGRISAPANINFVWRERAVMGTSQHRMAVE
jgi:hypothetical protein